MNISTKLTAKFANNRANDETLRENISVFPFLALILGVVFASLSSILTKSLMAELHPEAIIFNRFWIATVILGGFFVIDKFFINNENDKLEQIDKQRFFQLSNILLGIGSGVCLAATLITWAWSFNYTTVAHSCLLHYQNPIFATLGAWLFLGQVFDRKFLLGLILTVTGATLVSLQDLQFMQGNFFGDEIALFSGLLFSVALLLIEKMREQFSALTVTTSTCFFATVFAFPFALFNNITHGDPLFAKSLSGWILILSLGFVVQVIGHFLFYYSLKHISSGFAALALMLDISISTFLAWIIFAEQLTILDWLSFPVLFLGIYLAKSGKGVKKYDEL